MREAARAAEEVVDLEPAARLAVVARPRHTQQLVQRRLLHGA
ncbi:MAG: hypothetical protein ACKVI4_14760 [Actinomycetales bacterium]